jgi:hypothetical protein
MSPPAVAQTDLNLVLDRSERTVYVQRGATVIRTYEVAVGKPGHETPLGSWDFYQVDINPDWTPPDSDWAADASYTPPGHPDNPMGRVRMIFNRPYTIHGTEALQSIGRAGSHRAVGIGNKDGVEHCELLLREGGSWQGDAWFQNMLNNPKTMYEIPLERGIPITIRP